MGLPGFFPLQAFADGLFLFGVNQRSGGTYSNAGGRTVSINGPDAMAAAIYEGDVSVFTGDFEDLDASFFAKHPVSQ